MVRAPCCDKVGLKKGPWTPEEDQVLVSFIENHGHSNWRALPKQAGLLRCGKSCRLRWINYLKPDIKRGNFTKEEEDTIIQLHEKMGNRWSAIAGRLPGRTDNEIKNVWHTHLKKRLEKYQTTKPQRKTSTSKHQEVNSVKITNKSTKLCETSGGNTSDQVPTSSRQSYSSGEISSNTEVSSMELTNNINIVKNEQNFDIQQFDQDYFSIIDETFWSSQDVLSEDSNMSYVLDNIIDDHQLQQSFSENNSSELCNNFSSIYIEKEQGNYMDSMDYWIDVFVKAGGETELPEF